MHFCCPNCSNKFTYHSLNSEINQHDGYYKCSTCLIHVPVLNGITFFTETDISFKKNPADYSKDLKEELLKKRSDYERFIKQKITKRLVDPYSAFQPFNESSRAFYPFIKQLKEDVLKPNDIILDTWCRTGWSTFFLANMFPEQEVISIWEGNRDVLGYQGFDYWLSSEKKPKNARIIFTDLNKKLPLASDSIKLVYGLDTLHRYNQSSLIPELFRATSSDGVVIFPHIHLTNSSPDPFFERGERQLHGTDYDKYFKEFLTGRNMKAFINSEPRMFSLEHSESLRNDPNTKDYNAIIAVIPEELEGFKLQPYEIEPKEIVKHFILINPYLDIDLSDGVVKLDRNYLNGVVGEMLDRHPIYHKKISGANDFKLSDTQIKILYLANHNYSNEVILKSLRITEETFTKEVNELASIEIIHILPLSKDAKNLQSFHSAQHSSNIASHSLRNLRSIANCNYANEVIINSEDGSELSKDDTNYLISQIQERFCAEKPKRIVISSKPHFESLLVFWGAVEMGVEVCIVNSTLSSEVKSELLDDLEPGLVFVDSDVYTELSKDLTHIVVFDNPEFSENEKAHFSQWIEGETRSVNETDIQVFPSSDAVILFTSGTTGKPKGIKLSHGALYRSGRLFSEIFEWTNEDRLLMVSELDSMSGFRNVCVATQFSGTTVVVPDLKENNQIFSLVESIKKNQITLISATPALVNQLIQLGDKIRNEIKSIRQVICTGGKLTEKLAGDFENCFGIRIYNYYGLTETTGLCIGEYPKAVSNEYGSIGVAIDSVAQIVDENGENLGANEVGRLRVFNDRLMTGYLNDADKSNLQIKNGWLYTGDLALKDKKGFFYLKAREREIVKDQMGNVTYLAEVEDCLAAHSNVEAAVVSSVYYNEIEQLAAFIIPKSSDDLEDLKSNLKAHVTNKLGKWKSPMFIEFVGQFPATNRGQIDKKELIKSIK